MPAGLYGLLRTFPAQTISAYWPFQAEIDLREIMHRLRATGWITWTRQDLTIRDESRLRDLADYESVDKAPRPFI